MVIFHYPHFYPDFPWYFSRFSMNWALDFSQIRHARYANMGKELYRSEPVFRAAVDQCAELLDNELPKPLLEVVNSTGLGTVGCVQWWGTNMENEDTRWYKYDIIEILTIVKHYSGDMIGFFATKVRILLGGRMVTSGNECLTSLVFLLPRWSWLFGLPPAADPDSIVFRYGCVWKGGYCPKKNKHVNLRGQIHFGKLT